MPGVAGWAIAHSFDSLTRASLAISALLLAALLIYGWKLLAIPPRLADDTAARIAEMEKEREEASWALLGGENAKQGIVVRQLRELYVLSHDDASVEIKTGAQQPPVPWLNEQLEKKGMPWRVASTDGGNVRTYNLPLDEDGPNLTIRELFFGLDADVLDEVTSAWTAVGKDIQDQLSIGRLIGWGRRIGMGSAHPQRRAPLQKMEQGVWATGQFSYAFFPSGHELATHYYGHAPGDPHSSMEWCDLRFNLAEARRVWPTLVYPPPLPPDN